jgi:hypothetical protein
MEIRFNGGEADQHQIELFTGAESLSGIGRVGNLVSHYIATGEVRFRAPYNETVRFYMSGIEGGSLKVAVDQIARLGTEAASAAANTKAAKLLRRVMARSIGQAEEGELQLADGVVPSGTIDALAEASTAGMLRAHRWIDFGGKSIVVDPDGAQAISLNSDSKDYLETEEVAENTETQDVSVGALNVNSRNGRVYFHDLGRTVPFYVPRNAEDRTIPNLARYLTQYAEKTGATVNIQFRRVKFTDGRLKRVIVYDCYGLEDAA